MLNETESVLIRFFIRANTSFQDVTVDQTTGLGFLNIGLRFLILYNILFIMY